MISLEAFAAVLSSDPYGLAEQLPSVAVVEPAKGGRTHSVAATYADLAFRALPRSLAEPALVCLCGPTGPLVHAFDGAAKQSSDGRLTGAGFETRSKRIHPFTLLRSLGNGVCATLSTNHDLRGEYLNAVAHPTALAWMLPQIEAMLDRCRHVVLVMVSAGEQDEELAKRRARFPEADGLEGAICLLLGRESGLGMIRTREPDLAITPSVPEVPALAAGLELLGAFATGRDATTIELVDGDGRRAAIEWRRH